MKPPADDPPRRHEEGSDPDPQESPDRDQDQESPADEESVEDQESSEDQPAEETDQEEEPGEPLTRVECPAARDPAVRMFIMAAMLIAFGVWCLTDQRPRPKAWTWEQINDVLGYLVNNFSPYILLPVGIIVGIWGVRFLGRLLVADEEGIGYVGRDKIAWDEITELDATQLKKGFLFLYYLPAEGYQEGEQEVGQEGEQEADQAVAQEGKQEVGQEGEQEQQPPPEQAAAQAREQERAQRPRQAAQEQEVPQEAQEPGREEEAGQEEEPGREQEPAQEEEVGPQEQEAGVRLVLDSWKLQNFRDLVALIEQHVPEDKRVQ